MQLLNHQLSYDPPEGAACISYINVHSLSEGPVSQWRSVLDLNVLGLSICTKEALQSMEERDVDDGHIIHISRCCTSQSDTAVMR